MRHDRFSPGPTAQKSLALTGHQHENRVEIRANGTPVHLNASSFQLLIDLVLASAENEAGAARADKVAICRLRRALDQAVGPGTGNGLIETGMKRRYRLTIARDAVSLPPGAALVELGLVTADELERLHRHFPAVKPD